MSQSKVIKVEWFGRDKMVGFVLTYNEYDGFKVRLAPIEGLDRDEDVAFLVAHAAKIPFEWAWGIFQYEMQYTWQQEHRDPDAWTGIKYDGVDYLLRGIKRPPRRI